MKTIGVRQGSRWTDSTGKIFHVMNMVELDGKTWVHYEQDGVLESRTFSCWLDSFTERFKPILNEKGGR